ncbi:MAG: hypothetical protein M1819_000812 [Sarea resinae]|nr:MAG: hypothetical protein M1819_000812 [Sarea resinae]
MASRGLPTKVVGDTFAPWALVAQYVVSSNPSQLARFCGSFPRSKFDGYWFEDFLSRSFGTEEEHLSYPAASAKFGLTFCSHCNKITRESIAIYYGSIKTARPRVIWGISQQRAATFFGIELLSLWEGMINRLQGIQDNLVEFVQLKRTFVSIITVFHNGYKNCAEPRPEPSSDIDDEATSRYAKELTHLLDLVKTAIEWSCKESALADVDGPSWDSRLQRVVIPGLKDTFRVHRQRIFAKATIFTEMAYQTPDIERLGWALFRINRLKLNCKDIFPASPSLVVPVWDFSIPESGTCRERITG